MSENQLIEAYVKGSINRRTFIRGLLAAGASLTAALAYADTLAFGAGSGSGYGTTGGTGGTRNKQGGSAGSGTSGGTGGGGAAGGT